MTTYTHLLESFQPEHYNLSLAIHGNEKAFSGTLSLLGTLKSATNSITLHQKDLSLIKATINGSVATVKSDNVSTTCVLTVKQAIKPGTVKIEITFEGIITDAMQGMYPCYFDYQGAKQSLIATQFESHHAREVFPCVDEPSAKATFKLTLETDADIEVLSNTQVESQHAKDGRLVTTFDTTPKMSTYLLAFVVGRMHSVEKKTKRGTAIRSWASVAIPKSHLLYSAEEAVRIIEFFENYFDIDFPLPKCDQVALPDFDSGAMENWGLITYREVALLSDPSNPSIASERYVSLVVAHELSHQWFGNLVTMKWWDDLWLNESFASIMEHVALDAIHPDWQQWENYASTDIISTTTRDIHRAIQPVSLPVEDPELIETLFDPAIVYAKGARLIKMLIEFIGEDAFKSGLSNYFKEFAYSNASRSDLWQSLSQASAQDIQGLMTPWLLQPGLPVVNVRQEADDIKLSQSRFIVDGTTDETRWPIPLLRDKKPELLTDESRSFPATPSKLINLEASGHYVTQYIGQKLLDHLYDQVANQAVSPAMRINTLNDMILLSQNGQGKLVDALNLVLRMHHEDRDAVWSLMLRVLGTARSLTEGNEKVRNDLKTIKRSFAREQYGKLGWDESATDDPNTKLLRITMQEVMISADEESALTMVEQMLRQNTPSELNADLRHAILGSRIKHGDTELATTLMGDYNKVTQEVQQDFSLALSSTKDTKLAQQILERAIGKDGFVRHQDYFRWIIYFMRNYDTREVMWQFMVAEWDRLESIFKHSKSFDYIPTYTAMVINTEEWQRRYVDFFEPKRSIKMIERNITIGIDDIAARVQWRKREEADVKKWIAGQTA